MLLDRLRTSFDRRDNLALKYPKAKEMIESFHIYGAQYDLNYVKGVLFYNHASYIETYPQQKAGFKLRVDY